MNLTKLDNSNPADLEIIHAALDSYMCDFEESTTGLGYIVLSQNPTGPDVWAFVDTPVAGQVVVAVITKALWDSNVFYLINNDEYKPWRVETWFNKLPFKVW